MHVLAVRQPWASWIISGEKSIEVRTMPTNIRDYIAIYATRTKIRKEDTQWLETLEDRGVLDMDHISPEHLKEYPQGKIIGTVHLHACKKYQCSPEFTEDAPLHLNKPEWYNSKMWGWELASPRAINPIDFKFNGSMVWSKIDDKLIEDWSNGNIR